MAFNAYDVQIFLWKMLKLSSKTCVSFIFKHPLVSSSLFGIFLLYIFFPPFFWFFLYAFPPFVVIATILRIYFSLRNGKKYNNEEKTEATGSEKSMTRVHSVRRRKAINIQKEDEVRGKVVEKTAVFSSTFKFQPMVDKSAVIEETPKEIQEVKVNSSPVDDSAKVSSLCVPQSLKPESGEGSLIQSLEGSEEDEEEGRREDENKAAVQWTEEDQKNVMDVGISETERNKRLESLIARRRSRKLLSLQVRRTLMNTDRNDLPSQLTSLVIPKNNKKSFPTSSTFDGRFSPSPGSAPSVLVPMRNPFDLPYDPQEEKPDLTGDSFQQEFTPSHHKDMMFCRHESFSLGGFFPGEFNPNRAKASFFHDNGLRQSVSFQDYQISKLGDIFDRELTRVVNQEPAKVSKPESIIETEGDHIKEVIQVHTNGPDNQAEENRGEVQNESIQKENSDAMPSSSHESGTDSHEKENTDKPHNNKPTTDVDTSSSSSSSDEEAPYFKIDKEAVLRSLSSLARRNVVQVKETYEKIEDPLSLDEHLYYANKTMNHHHPSYSIASDLQVEVSDISSPPLTIDENFTSYDEDIFMYEMDTEKKSSFGSEYLWEGSSNLFEVENGSSSRQANEDGKQDAIEIGYSTIKKSEERNLSNPIEDKVSKENFINPFSSLPTVPELSDRGKAVKHTVLHKNIPETSEKSLSLDSQKAILPETSVFPASEAAKQSTREVVTISSQGNSSGKQAEIIRSPEDSAERLKSIPESDRKLTIATVVENHGNLATNQHNEGEASSSTRTTVISSNNTTLSSNNPQPLTLMRNPVAEQVPVVHSSSSSPKSVLQPAFSLDNLSSFDHDNYQDIHQLNRNTEVLSPVSFQFSTPLSEHSTALPPSGRDVEKLQETGESSRTSTTEVESSEFANKQRLHEDGAKLKEVASSSIHVLNSHETSAEQLKPIAEASSRCTENENAVPSKNLEAAHSTAISKNTDEASHSKSPLSSNDKSAESSRTSIRGIESTEFANNQRLHEDSAKHKEVASSNIHEFSSHKTSAEQLKPTAATSSRCIKNDDMSPSKNPEATHLTTGSRNTDEANKSKSPVSTIEVLAESLSTSTTKVDSIESANEQKLHENSAKLKEVARSSLPALGSKETPDEMLKPIQEATSKCLRNDDTIPSKNLEAPHPTVISKNIDDANNSKSTLSTNEESPESSRTSTSGANSTVSANKSKLHENSTKINEVAGSSLHVLSSDETPAELLKIIEETSLKSIENNDAIPRNNLEAGHPTVVRKNTDEANNSKSSLSTSEEPSKNQEKVIGKTITHNNINTSKSSGNQRENSELHKDSEHKREPDNPSDHKGGTTSTSTNSTEKTKDEVQNLNAVQTSNTPSVLVPVQENENSELQKKTEHDSKGNQHVNSHESVPDKKKS